MRGTTETAASVQSIFARIAHRYDLANHLLSFNMDRYWRGRTVASVRPVLERPGARVLDLCCGTGDLLLSLESARGSAALGSDFCHPMLLGARRKIQERSFRSQLFEADALCSPLRDRSVDLVTIAFGFRNLADYDQGLREIYRILRPSGMAAILEFSHPPNPVFGALYGFYSRRLLPLIGSVLSGSRDAYTYLPHSVERFFTADELAARMVEAGFQNVRYRRMTGGIVALHTGIRSA